MERAELTERLIGLLLRDMPEYRRAADEQPGDPVSRRRLLRGLMNLRPAMPLDPEFIRLQDRLLSEERDERGVVDAMAIPGTPGDSRLAIWQGDITRLRADAIVNAANSALLGCFYPCHGCIDNAIHSAAGLQLRDECSRLMRARGHAEPNGQAELTRGYNLPSRFVLHTVGPVVSGRVTDKNRAELASCYRSCLELAGEKGLKSLAFCCISTGEFQFPNRKAAEIAVSTVREFLERGSSVERVVFNVFKDEDLAIYSELLL